MQRTPLRILCLLLLASAAVASMEPQLRAEQPQAAASPTSGEQKDMQKCDRWVEQLGHERLTVRQKARKQLLDAGKSAIPALAKAALSGRRETIERSIEILGKLGQSSDDATRESARTTLRMLSDSEQPSTAERAAAALNAQEAAEIQPFEGWDEAGNEFGGGGQNRTVSVMNVNGIRTLTVQDGGQETVIREQPGGTIRVQIAAGEKKVQLKAKNAADLRRRSPEAYALYRQYLSGSPNGGLNAAAAASAQGAASQMMLKQLRDLQQQMGGNPMMQTMLQQQIQMIAGNEGLNLEDSQDDRESEEQAEEQAEENCASGTNAIPDAP